MFGSLPLEIDFLRSIHVVEKKKKNLCVFPGIHILQGEATGLEEKVNE